MKKENFQLLKRLVPFVPFKSLLFVLLVLSPVSMAFSYFQPLVLKSLTDKGILQQNAKVLFLSAGLLLGMGLFSQLLDYLQAKLFSRIYNEAHFRLFDAAYQKILHLKMQYFETHTPSEIINTMQADVTNLASVANNTTNLLLRTGLRIVSGVIGLCLISPKLALALLLLIPLQWFSSKFLAQRKEKAVTHALHCGREFYAWMGDDLSGMQEIKLWGLSGFKKEQLRQKLREVLRCNRENAVLDAVKTFVDGSFMTAMSCLIYLLGGVMVIQQRLTMGELLAFIEYSAYVISPLTYLFSIKYSFAGILPSAKRFFDFLALEEEPSTGQQIPAGTVRFDLTLRNVSFRYPESEREVLKHVDLFIPYGKKIAIIGENGSGKSTLLKLLLRLSEPTAGTILLNQTEISKIKIEDYRALFSVVSQTPHLFSGTVMDNVSLGRQLCAEHLALALQKSGAFSFVQKLPQKEKSAIGVNGTQISGGERQKLNVARALARKAPIVILDEATSAFDVQSVDYLNHIIQTEFPQQTVLVITHQYELLEHMDAVYKLADGTLIPLDHSCDTVR